MGLLEEVEDFLENSVVDFHGQFYSNVAMWIIISSFAFVGFAYGYIKESFQDTVKFIVAGTAVSVLASLRILKWFYRFVRFPGPFTPGIRYHGRNRRISDPFPQF